MIAQGDILPPGQGDGRIGIAGDPEVFRSMDQAKAGFLPGSLIQRAEGGGIRAVPVVKDYLQETRVL